MNSKTLRRDICVKVCGREAMMQEKSKEQGNGQKRGYNLLDKEEQKSMLSCFVEQLCDPLIFILFAAAAISLLLREYGDMCIILAVVLLNAVVGVIQEGKAKRALEALEKMTSPHALIHDEDGIREIPAADLIPGDIVCLEAGRQVPADIRIISAVNLKIEESALTGESVPVSKNTTDQNEAYMTTNVTYGRGEGIVTAIGMDTKIGGIAKLLSGTKTELTPLQKRLADLGKILGTVSVFLCILLFVMAVLQRRNVAEMLITAISLAVAAVPEGLPAIVTMVLALSVSRMVKVNTIVKRLPSVETLGCVSVVCSDKTGTLTNESILLEYYMDVLGNESTRVLDFAFLNSVYHSGVCNPIDNAILACQTMPGRSAYYTALLAQYQKTDEIPFDYARKFVSTLVTEADGAGQLIIKGDIAHVVARCGFVEYRDAILPMDEDKMRSVTFVVDEMLQDGMKVIAVARKRIEKQNRILPEDEQSMILMGYLAFFDAPKKTAKTSVEALKRLKVTPKILTGDQADVAVSVCRRVGIPSETVLTGAQMDEMTDAALGKAVEKIHVFAELTPGQKVRLVSALSQNGHTVGFLGDGINDIPALCEANVGISVDTAVDAAKDAADVVLLQKDLGVLEQGILEGRKTFTNMLKYIKITASSNFGNIFSIVCASAFLPFLPMTSLQILLLNLLYDVLCIILPWDNVDEEETLSPRDWSGRTLGRFMLSFGPISSLFDIVTFLFLYYILCPMLCGGVAYQSLTDSAMQLQYISLFQTGWFLESMWTQVLILHFLRTRKIPFVQSRPSAPVICITLAGIIAFTAITFTKGAAFFGLTHLPFWYFIFLLIVALLYMLLTTVVKAFYQKKYHELI